jgi:hypothetical protein
VTREPVRTRFSCLSNLFRHPCAGACSPSSPNFSLYFNYFRVVFHLLSSLLDPVLLYIKSSMVYSLFTFPMTPSHPSHLFPGPSKEEGHSQRPRPRHHQPQG